MPDSAEDNGACRICMDPKDNYVSLFSFDLSKKVMEIADVQVEKDDGLPNSICTECEQDLEKCYEFRLKVQVADKKFRENIKFPQVDIEECNIKEESYVDDGNSDNMDDKDSVSMDDEQYNDVESDVAPKITEETETAVPDPLNHVVVVEEKEKKIDVSNELLCQDDAMTEEPRVQKIEEVALDQLTCMKEEAETEIMDVDSSQPDPFGPSSSGYGFEHQRLTVFPNDENLGKERLQPKQTYLVKNSESPKSFTIFPGSVVRDDQIILERTSAETQTEFSSQSLIPKITLEEKVTWIENCHKHLASDLSSSSTVTQDLSYSDQNNTGNNLKRTECKNFVENKFVNKLKLNLGKIFHKNIQQQTSNTDGERNRAQSSPTLPLSPEEETGKPDDESFCPICNVQCGSVELLGEHRDGIEFFCRVCTDIFKNHTALETHFTSHKSYKCRPCGKIFYLKRDLHNHRNAKEQCKHQKRFICSVCNKDFASKKGVLNHKYKYHPGTSSSASYPCIVCKKQFVSPQLLASHERITHSAYEEMECSTCHIFLQGPEKLKKHVINVHISNLEGSSFDCPTCGKTLPTKNALNYHLKEVHDNSENICDICGETVKGYSRFKFHIRTQHSDEGVYTCKVCNEDFDSNAKLMIHRKKTHYRRKPKPVFCEMCGKEFKSSTILKNHMRIHFNEKPFVCDECGAAFRVKVTLDTHKRIHNSVGKYICNQCGQSFNWRQTFEKHVFKCESPANN